LFNYITYVVPSDTYKDCYINLKEIIIKFIVFQVFFEIQNMVMPSFHVKDETNKNKIFEDKN
jgi:hypothetical protein